MNKTKITDQLIRTLDFQVSKTVPIADVEPYNTRRASMSLFTDWWKHGGGTAKFFALNNFAWMKIIRRLGNRGTRQHFSINCGKNSESVYGGYFYMFSTLKVVVRNLRMHQLYITRFYEAVDRLTYLRALETKHSGAIAANPVRRSALISEIENISRHLQSAISFGIGYKDIYHEFAKCYVEFVKSVGSMADNHDSESFWHNMHGDYLHIMFWN